MRAVPAEHARLCVLGLWWSPHALLPAAKREQWPAEKAAASPAAVHMSTTSWCTAAFLLSAAEPPVNCYPRPSAVPCQYYSAPARLQTLPTWVQHASGFHPIFDGDLEVLHRQERRVVDHSRATGEGWDAQYRMIAVDKGAAGVSAGGHPPEAQDHVQDHEQPPSALAGGPVALKRAPPPCDCWQALRRTAGTVPLLSPAGEELAGRRGRGWPLWAPPSPPRLPPSHL